MFCKLHIDVCIIYMQNRGAVEGHRGAAEGRNLQFCIFDRALSLSYVSVSVPSHQDILPVHRLKATKCVRENISGARS